MVIIRGVREGTDKPHFKMRSDCQFEKASKDLMLQLEKKYKGEAFDIEWVNAWGSVAALQISYARGPRYGGDTFQWPKDIDGNQS